MKIVRVTARHGTYEGVQLPGSGHTTVLKLANGYNIGIKKNSIEHEEILGERPQAQKVQHAVTQANLPLVSILHLGGTIASKVDYATGAVTSHFHPDELLQMFPELRAEARVESRLVRNMMSGAMQPGHYNAIAQAVAEEIEKKPKGIIISHGTDTMAWTASALAFMLENVPVPVLLVGSQRSSDRGSSDAGLNLLSAVHFIVNTHWRGVGICMHKTSHDDVCWVLPGVKASKMHTSRRDTFRPINSKQVADIDVKNKTITYSNSAKTSLGEFRLRTLDAGLKVGIIKMHPGLRHSELDHYEGYNGLLIEGTGLGHAPVIHYDDESTENKAIAESISKLAAKMPVALVSQSKYGRTNMQVYNYGRLLLQAGVLGHNTDMTVEAAYCKLLWLLSNEPDEVRKLYAENLRGEISDRTEPDTFLL